MQYLDRMAVIEGSMGDRKVLHCCEVKGLETCVADVQLNGGHSGGWSGYTDGCQEVEIQQEQRTQKAQ